MAARIDFLIYKTNLPWYKRLLFPMFLNQKEWSEFIDKFGGEVTEYDICRDLVYYEYKQHVEHPNTSNYNSWKTACNIAYMVRDREIAGEKLLGKSKGG